MNTLFALALLASIATSYTHAQAATDASYQTFRTKTYSIDLPTDWKVSEETWFGQRKAEPVDGKGEIGIMTAPTSRQSWDQLYETALYFVLREQAGTPTEFRMTKTKQGYEAASFEVLNKQGWADRRFVMIKHPAKGLLALSVNIPDSGATKTWESYFKRMVDSAKFIAD
jgi:hypothetical protein